MNEQLLFFQALAKFLDKERIRVSFDRPPKLDRTFWEDADDAQKNEDRAALEKIAECLRENTSDFECIEKITCIMEDRGFDSLPRHDF